MIFYASLFILSLFAAFVGLWIYHSIARAGKTFSKFGTPGAKSGPTSHLRPKAKRATKSGAPTPWGWKSHDTPANLAKTHAAKPPVTLRNPYIPAKSKSVHTPDAGWLNREEKSELGGKAYKVTRSVDSTAAEFKTADRPWDW
jgi:hypothetical protein